MNLKSSAGKAATKHPFGELLGQYRARKSGLTQSRLAELAGYNQAILVRMCQGKKDLTGPSGRERIVRLIETLVDQGALSTQDEANALLLAADLPPLFDRQPNEAHLIARLAHLPAGQRTRRTNLPAPLTSFIGRVDEIAEVRRLLGQTRLLTLTGPGGSGKTRLAQQIAADMLITYSDGVWYAELAPLADPTQVADLVLRALGFMALNRPALEQLMDQVRERHLLLVLDNCEHLIEAMAAFSISLLQACPRVTILATSREALNVEGERMWQVPPMQPDEAGRLFTDRAMAAHSNARLHPEDKIVAHICQRLDGMPLAIELAAARLSVLSLNDIALRLDDRFNLLAQGRRGALPRHQTLRALIDWSYELLSEPERKAFCRLGVFVGGWTLEQAEQVIRDEDIRPAQVLPTLTQLVNKSLVGADNNRQSTRYYFLETLREYALERLVDEGTLNAVRHRHAETCMTLVERCISTLHNQHQRATLIRLEADYANIQTALNWTMELDHDAELGCRLTGALFHFWYIASGHHSDAQKWTGLAKRALREDMAPAVHAWVLMNEEWFSSGVETAEARCQRIYALFEQAGDRIHAAMVKSILGRAVFYARRDYATALRLSEAAVDEARALGADWELRFNLTMLAECLRFAQHDPARAERVYHESMVLSKAAGDANEVARILGYYINGFAMERLQFDDALRYSEEALQLAQQTDDVVTEVHCRCRIAENRFYLGDTAGAMVSLKDSLALAAEQLMPEETTHPKLILARIALAEGRYVEAGALLTDVFQMRRQAVGANAFLWGGHDIVDAMAALSAAQNQATRAARLRGLADHLFALNHHYRWANLAWEYAPYIAKARETLGEEAFEAAYAQGQTMTPEQAMDDAL